MFFLFSLASCARYAILYAGSGTYVNYRHQADIYTIYTQLLSRGFTSSNILLFAKDDIADNYENPFQGQIFHTTDHKVNVYPGSDSIDFKGKDVTDKALYDSITGLPTSVSDYVFIYYDNHGGPGILGTPNSEEITGEKLNDSFKKASELNLYKKCLFIIEACYSGSVAELFNAPNLATITTANGCESSYAAVFDEKVGTYLSNECTNYFIALIDESPEISVSDLFWTLKKKTALSHVCYYGDESIQSIQLSEFIGKPNKQSKSCGINEYDLKLVTQREATEQTLKLLSQNEKASIRSRARLQMLKYKALSEKLEAVLEMLVQYVDQKNYEKIMNDTQSKITPTYFQVLKIFTQKFGEVNPDDYGKFNILKALSATHSKAEIVQGIYAVLY